MFKPLKLVIVVVSTAVGVFLGTGSLSKALYVAITSLIAILCYEL